MKDVDTCSCHTNALIYQYRVTTFSKCYYDLTSRPFVYKYDVFHNCLKFYHVIASFTTLVTIYSSVTVPSALHPFSSISSIVVFFHLSTNLPTTPIIFITPETDTWLAFTSIISSFTSLFCI